MRFGILSFLILCFAILAFCAPVLAQETPVNELIRRYEGGEFPAASVLPKLLTGRVAERGIPLEHFDGESLASCFALNKRIKGLLTQS